MNKKTFLSVATATLVTTLAVVGVTYAATPASNDTSLLNKGTVEVDSLKVGKQGTGGVTFFNGTIVNSTTNNGADNPVTFGDNVRIDGTIYRGDTAGAGGGIGPVKIDDDAEVAGNSTISGNETVAGTLGVTGATSVSTLSATGDVTQSVTGNGIAKAWAHFGAGGNLIKGYNVESVSKQATGTYNVTLNFDPADRIFSATASGSSDDTVAIRFAGAVNSATDNTVRVRVYDATGALSDGVTMLVVY